MLLYLFSGPAKILFITPSNTYEKGSRVELVCAVKGKPPPYVAWINATDGSVLQNRTVDTSYVIPGVSSLDKGTYRCVTENFYGGDSINTTIIDVFGKYHWWELPTLLSLTAFIGIFALVEVPLKFA